MKRAFKSVVSLCVIMVVLFSCMSIPAMAATVKQAVNALSIVCLYDVNSGDIVDSSLDLAVLVKIGGTNYALTKMPHGDAAKGILPVLITANGDVEEIDYSTELAGLNLFLVDNRLDADSGFIEVGNIKTDDIGYILYLNEEGEPTFAKTKVSSRDDDFIQVETKFPSSLFGLLFNSEYQPCGVISGGSIYSFYGDEGSSGDTPAPTEVPAAPEASAEAPQEDYRINYAGPLPSFESIKSNAVIKPKVPVTLYIAIGAAVVVAAAGAAVVVSLKKRKHVENTPYVPSQADEGTQLANYADSFDAPITGLCILLSDGNMIPISKNITVGRAPDNMVITDRQATTISGHHCIIEVHGTQCFLRDTSSNGTFINGKKLMPNRPVQLQNGMFVALGSVNSRESFRIIASEGSNETIM